MRFAHSTTSLTVFLNLIVSYHILLLYLENSQKALNYALFLEHNKSNPSS